MKTGGKITASLGALSTPFRQLHSAILPKELAKAIHQLLQNTLPTTQLGVLFRPMDFEMPLSFTFDPDTEALNREWMAGGYQKDLWLKRAGTLNPTHQVMRHTDHTPHRVFRSSNFFKKWLRNYGIHYGAAVLVWRKQQWLLLVYLLRNKEQGDFTDAEMTTLRALYPQIALAVRRVTRVHFMGLQLQSLQSQLALLPTATLLLDWELNPVFYNKAAKEAVQIWREGPQKNQRLKPALQLRSPVELLAVCRNLKAELETNAGPAPEAAAVVHPLWPDVRAEIQVVKGRSAPLIRAFFLVHFSQPKALASTAAALDLSRLSPRELAVIRLVASGKTNREIGKALHKSPATIKNQLHAVFKKLGLTRRMQLAAKHIST